MAIITGLGTALRAKIKKYRKMADDKDLEKIKQLLDVAENNIRQAKSILFVSELGKRAARLDEVEDGKIVEGIFNGDGMIGPRKKQFPVPANYASKSKLIPGDLLKLTILPDGSFVFKQIGPVPRKKVVGLLQEIGEGKFIVRVGEKEYSVLSASITYFKAENGDKLTIIVPEENESEWAAVENLIERGEK